MENEYSEERLGNGTIKTLAWISIILGQIPGVVMGTTMLFMLDSIKELEEANKRIVRPSVDGVKRMTETIDFDKLENEEYLGLDLIADLFNMVPDRLDIVNKKRSVKYRLAIRMLEKYLKTLSDYNETIEKEIYNMFPSKVLFWKKKTIKQSAYLAMASDIGTIHMFLMEVLIVSPLTKDNMDDSEYKRFRKLSARVTDMKTLMRHYQDGDVKQRLLDIQKLSDTIVNEDTLKNMNGLASKADREYNPPINGFINNPFLHWGMYRVDVKLDKMELLKEKQKLLQHRIIELQNEQASIPNKKTQEKNRNQIEKIKDVIDDMELEIIDKSMVGR